MTNLVTGLTDSDITTRGTEGARMAADPSPSGWTAEHTSWWKPGSVSSAVVAPPPGVGAAS